MKIRGFSLLETVVATFLLVSGFCIFAALQQFSLASSSRSEQRLLAARTARNRLQALRSWAGQPTGASDNFEEGNWAALAAPVSEAFGASRCQTSVALLSAQIYSPCGGLESGFADPIEMSDAVKRVLVKVEWGGNQQFELISHVGAPRRAPHTPLDEAIVISGASAALVPLSGTVDLTARTLAASGPDLRGLRYRWNVLPGSGTASIVLLDRQGTRARFKNEVNSPSGPTGNPGPGPKTCKVTVSAIYAGLELSGTSIDLNLETLP